MPSFMARKQTRRIIHGAKRNHEINDVHGDAKVDRAARRQKQMVKRTQLTLEWPWKSKAKESVNCVLKHLQPPCCIRVVNSWGNSQ